MPYSTHIYLEGGEKLAFTDALNKAFQLNTEKTGKLLLAIIVALAVLQGLQYVAETVDISALPSSLQPAMLVLKAFVVSGTGLFFFGLGRNVVGYLRNFWSKNYKETYDVNRLFATYAYYQAVVGGALALVEILPTQYREPIIAIVGIAAILLDFVMSEVGKLKAKPASTAPTKPPT